MMERLLPSRFSYDEGCTITETTEQTDEKPSSPATGEKVIVSMLKKYGFLTLPLISKNIELSHRTINAKKSIKKMQQRGLVKKYTITYTDDDTADIDVYVLTEEGLEISGESPERPYRTDMGNIPYILENLSIAQWHMAALSARKVQEVMYQHTVRTSGNIVMLPSLIRYKTNIGKSLYLCGVPIEKGIHRKDLGRFITKILLINSYLASNPNKYKSYIMVISCESQRQIEEIAEILSGINETREIYFMYTIDSITADDGINPLQMLYDVEKRGDTYTARLTSLN